MYLDYFGFTQAPFSITPDPGFLFLSHDHKEAFAHLLYGVGDTGGFVQLTGEVGTGKTTLCRYLLENTPEEIDVALILNPRQSALELVASICDELAVDYPRDGDSIKALIDRLNAHLLDRHSQGRRTVLVIDEAQNLSVDVLEQIRLLTNLETTRHKLLQILLIGQPELQAIMDRPELRQLDQRITARYHLTPLSLTETIAYISHRLDVAGCQKKLFTKSALKQIYRRSQGVPRLINIICDRALLGAYAEHAAHITPRLVKQADHEIKGKPATSRAIARWAWVLPALALLVFGGGWAYTQWPFEKAAPLQAQVGNSPPSNNNSTTQPAQPPSTPLPAEKDETVTPVPEEPVTAKQEQPQTEPIAEPAAKEEPAETESAPPGKTEPATASADNQALSEVAETTRPEAVDFRSELLALAATPEIQPVPAPQPLPDDLVALLGSDLVPTDARTAYTELFRYWQLDFNDLPGHTACVRALSVGLRCLSKTGSFRRLTIYNRPAVLTLFDDQGRVHYVTVAALDGDRLTLNIGGHEKQFDQAEVMPVWNGQFVLLWRPPLLEHNILHIGSQGNDVLWLRDRLARIEGGTPPTEKVLQHAYFDEDLRQQVIRFQERNGLQTDGMVGENTLLYLNIAAGESLTPVLTAPMQEQTH